MNAFAAAGALRAPTVSCRHCGDPCDDDTVVRAGADAFCCGGCAAVHALLQARGLEDFYVCDLPSPGVSQKAAPRGAASLAALDDPAVAKRVLDFDDGVRASATFAVPDLHCGACLWLIERLWRVDDGILRADANLVRRTVTVWFTPARLSLRAVAERLAAIGYTPALDAEAHATPTSPASPGRRALHLRLGVAGFAFGNIMLFSIPRYANGAPLEGGFQRLFDLLNIALATPVLLYSASGYFTSAWRALQARRVTLEVPVAIGLTALFLRSLADILLSRGEGFMDSFTGLVFFLLVGRLFQTKTFERIAFDRTFRSFLPLSVRVERGDGVALTPLDALRAGDRIQLRPHEVVPADALLISDSGRFDYAFVTGESRPVERRAGDRVPTGGRVIGAAVRLVLTGDAAHSELARLWDTPPAPGKTSWLTDVSGRFGAGFTVLVIALAIAGAWRQWPDVTRALEVATAVLIIACPCALTLAAPLTFGTAMDRLARRGLHLRHSAAVLDLSRIDAIAFDKTGTLTTASGGAMARPSPFSEEDWRLVRRLAAESTHPVSRAIAAGPPAPGRLREFHDTPGYGLRGLVDSHDVVLGLPAFVARESGAPVTAHPGCAAVAIDGRFAGVIDPSTAMRPGLDRALRELAESYEVCLVSGDDPRDKRAWDAAFDGRAAFSQTPTDKLDTVRAQQAGGRRVAMVGDGLNDAGALAAADVGIAVSDETACIVPACDAVLDGARVPLLPAFLRYARRARQTVWACFLVSLVYNAVGLALALQGQLTPLATAILMPVSSLTVMAMSVGGMRWFAREIGA